MMPTISTQALAELLKKTLQYLGQKRWEQDPGFDQARDICMELTGLIFKLEEQASGPATESPANIADLNQWRKVWAAALTLANNICVQESNRENDKDGDTGWIHGTSECARQIRGWMSPQDPSFIALLREAGALPKVDCQHRFSQFPPIGGEGFQDQYCLKCGEPASVPEPGLPACMRERLASYSPMLTDRDGAEKPVAKRVSED